MTPATTTLATISPCATRLFDEVATPRDFDALDRLEMETANIAAAGWWLLGRDRLEELMAFFECLPFVDQWAVAPTTVDELGAFAGEALMCDGASTMPGFPYACYWAAVRVVQRRPQRIPRDVRTRRTVSRRRVVHPDAHRIIHHGAHGGRHRPLRSPGQPGDRGSTRFRRRRAPRLHTAYVGGNTASVGDPARALPLADEALAVARTVGGSVALLFALQAVCSAAVVIDPDRSLEAGTEAMRLDRTRRRTWANGWKATRHGLNSHAATSSTGS